ncbi:HTH domain-containing protein, partial [Actinoplanes sp. NPDC051633]|uniref:helix-turn-helix transcriptional regulator n=1 Tax=Actinoplanes sp. NPDC051633 TaxID=3155670 RepID=UPI00342F2BCB
AHGQRVELSVLAAELGVAPRTVARDVARLRESGVPVDAYRGRDGGVRLRPARAAITIDFDLPEVAALMSTLAVLGPTVSESAASAMRKLVVALSREA